MSNSSQPTVDGIRARFDQDVERFSNLETGQSATVDAPLSLGLIAQAAYAATPHAKSWLDLGCGTGNFTLRLLQQPVDLSEITLLDLSLPMLERAQARVLEQSSIQARCAQADLRQFEFEQNQFDLILAGAVLHRLRADEEWQTTFKKIFHSLKPGGSFWIFDLVSFNDSRIQQLMDQRYGNYLVDLKDESYRDHVFPYIATEEAPFPLFYQLQLLSNVGFTAIDVLHSHTCFAEFGGLKSIAQTAPSPL